MKKGVVFGIFLLVLISINFVAADTYGSWKNIGTCTLGWSYGADEPTVTGICPGYTSGYNDDCDGVPLYEYDCKSIDDFICTDYMETAIEGVGGCGPYACGFWTKYQVYERSVGCTMPASVAEGCGFELNYTYTYVSGQNTYSYQYPIYPSLLVYENGSYDVIIDYYYNLGTPDICNSFDSTTNTGSECSVIFQSNSQVLGELSWNVSAIDSGWNLTGWTNSGGTLGEPISCQAYHPSYQCTGTPPSNSHMCPDDSIGLISDTPIAFMDSCSNAKCEYVCKPDYVKSGNVCVLGPLEGANCHKYANESKVLCLAPENNCTWTPPLTDTSPEGSCCQNGEEFQPGIGCGPTENLCFFPFSKTNIRSTQEGFGLSEANLRFDTLPSSPQYCAQVTSGLTYGFWYPTETY